MKSVLLAIVTMTGIAAGLGGCKGRPPTEPFTPRADHIPLEAYPKITAPAELAQYLAVSDTTVERGPVMKVTTPVRLISRPGEWSKVQYRYIFLNDRGLPVREQPEWTPVTLEPQQQVFLSQNSLDSDAVDWRLEIRPQR
ncbi:MAG TPA: DUF1425 domain-containing protein [Phycisphaerales bacterium]|nr:DUF1425 domain-containing protein [Phycisphaerales bacterium]